MLRQRASQALRSGSSVCSPLNATSSVRPATPWVQSRRIATLQGEVVVPTGPGNQLMRSSNANMQFRNREFMVQATSAFDSQGAKDRKVAQVRAIPFLIPGTAQHALLQMMFAQVADLAPFVRKHKLKHKKGELTQDVVVKEKLSRSSQEVLLASLKGEPLPFSAVRSPIAAVMELADLAQKMMQLADPKGGKFMVRRQQAERELDGVVTHPAAGFGVFLENDPGSIVAVRFGVPVHGGTSGTTSNTLNGLVNLGMEVPRDFLEVLVPMFADLGSAYFGGAIEVDIFVEEEQRVIETTVPKIVGARTELAVRKVLEQCRGKQPKEVDEIVSQLVAVEQGQTHTRIEVLNAAKLTGLEILSGPVSEGRAKEVREENAAAVRTALDEVD